MLFVFRGIRMFQLLLAAGALATGVGAVFSAKAVADSGTLLLMPVPLLLGLVFIWLFGAALRAPTSYVAVSERGMRIRFAGFVDTVVASANIAGASTSRWPLWGGLGVRTAFRGDAALASTWGESLEVSFREPVRIWVIPRLLPAHVTRLTLTIRNPAKLAAHFGPPPVTGQASPPVRPARKMKRRGPRTR